MEKVKQDILRELDELAEDLYTLSKTLYDNPEVAFEEYQTSATLGTYLEGQGFEVEYGVGDLETAFYAKRPGKETRPALAFLAEYDALPNIGHGCGHNLIAAASIGAGVALSRHLDAIDGSMTIIGTPAEEGGGGKVILINAGVFDKIDAAMMFHPGSRNLVGSESLGRIKFDVEFFGKTAHAAAEPEEGLNALDALIALFCNIGLLRQQLKDDARVHGVILKGGDVPNVIPDYTSAQFYVRALNLDYLEDVYRKVCHCAEAAALATGTELRITEYPLRYEPRKRSRELEKIFQTYMETFGLEAEQEESGKMGSTDLGNLSRRIPAIHPYLAIVDNNVPGHSKALADATMTPRGQNAMLNAAKLLALTAYDYLSSKELQSKVAEEFQRT
ncbi:amidohydrolase [candidate division KSB3 bacterium]|uniref:Peptidase M20 domain-containing protein 2 n=1 Tax=candidate division KSB3 bacterium TaxID=2044937 RepID=A0A2G6E850_9BACT|nr:MAG: amidohydrolase [candidate division KSB3 bacterium]PIE30584.1 MAG: amidohydrolase [candidate division KSB3 bacterium]